MRRRHLHGVWRSAEFQYQLKQGDLRDLLQLYCFATWYQLAGEGLDQKLPRPLGHSVKTTKPSNMKQSRAKVSRMTSLDFLEAPPQLVEGVARLHLKL